MKVVLKPIKMSSSKVPLRKAWVKAEIKHSSEPAVDSICHAAAATWTV